MVFPDSRLSRRGFIKATAAAAIAAPAAGCIEYAEHPTNQAVPGTPIPVCFHPHYK